MAPIEMGLDSEQYTIDIIPSKIVETFAAMPVLANRKNSEFEKEFAEGLYNRLSPKSREFLDLISGLKFPGAEFFGFFLNEGIYSDFDRFLERVSGYTGTDFVYLAFDRDIPRERIEGVRSDVRELPDFISDLCCHLWKGDAEPVRSLLYDTENFKTKFLGLAKEIYYDAEFGEIIESLSGTYRKVTEEIRRRLERTAPMELAREIKGRSFSTDRFYQKYIFLPAYFLNQFNVASWDYERSIFMLYFHIKTDAKVDSEEIDRFLSVLKSLSDRTRLQILQRLRSEPSYGKKLAEELNLSTASISRQLDQLRSMNLITEEKSDGYKYFKLNNKEIDKLVKSIQEFFAP